MYTTLPNGLSILRILLSPVFYVLFVSPDPVLRQASVAVFFAAAVTDWYDGVIARRSNTVTRVGKFLDPLADKFLTSAAFIAFASIGSVEWWMVAAIIVRDVAVTLLRSLAEVRNAPIVTSKSAQTKTFVQMTALYYLLILLVSRDVPWLQAAAGSVIDALLAPAVVYALMLAVTALTLLTGVQYLYDNRSFLASLLVPRRVAN